jgi:hypothetical protein
VNRQYNLGADIGVCYRYTCESGGKVIRFHIQGGPDIICTDPGFRKEAGGNFRGSIICPDPAFYCNKININLSYFFYFNI